MSKSYRQGLVWLLISLALPLCLTLTLILGHTQGDPTASSSLTSGIFAYSWLLGLLLLRGKRAFLSQLALALASLPLSTHHAQVNPGLHLGLTFGQLGLLGLLALCLYSLLFWFSQGRQWRLSQGLTQWFYRLACLTVILVFAHVQLLAEMRSNLPFMVAFYLLTGLALTSYFLGKKAPATETVPLKQTETA